MSLTLLPLLSYAYNVNISGYTSTTSYNGYPLFDIGSDETSIIVSSTRGEFKTIYINDVYYASSSSLSGWSNYTIDISHYNYNTPYKLQLQNGYQDYGTCYFRIVPVLNFDISGNEAYVTSAYKGVRIANIPDEYEYDGKKYPVTEISDNAFEDCTDLTDVTLPASITRIGWRAFFNCKKLKSIEFPPSLLRIEGQAFSNCISLTSVTIPESVTWIGYYAFYNYSWDSMTSSLTDVFFNAVNCNTAGMYDSCPDGDDYCMTVDNIFPNSVTKVEIGNKVTKLPAGIFKGTGISDISIPEGVTSIGAQAFCNCWKLPSISIPASVKSIDWQAFYWCDKLTSVTCLPDIPPTIQDDYYGEVFSTRDARLNIPLGAYAAYLRSNWSCYFKNIHESSDILAIEIIGNGTLLRDNLTPIQTGTKFVGNNFTFLILPDDGNHLSSITLEGKDIISELVNHKLTISHFKGIENGKLAIEFNPDEDATLTVKGSDNHSISHTYKRGTCAVVKLQPEEAWKIHSVTYNGTDVTDRLNENTFITEPLQGDNNLNLVLVNDTPTDIPDLETTECNIRITANRNRVAIHGLETYETVSVYDAGGKIIYSGYDHTLTLTPGNIYLISAKSKTFKIVL